MKVNDDTPPPLCPECRNSVNTNANRCGSCGVVLRPLKRRILQTGALVSALLVILPLWQLVVLTTDLFKREVYFDVEISDCSPKGISVSFANLESDRFLEWSEVQLQSVDGVEINENMKFLHSLANIHPRHIAPLDVKVLNFSRSSGAVPFDSICPDDSCEIVVEVMAKETDGAQPTSRTASCTWYW